MANNIMKALEELDMQDIYHLDLYVLSRLKNVIEYAVLSELVYILDEGSFARFFCYFEGQMLRVPKISEIEDILNALLFYERKMNTSDPDDKILKDLSISVKDKEKLYKILNLVSEILKDYNFERKKSDDSSWQTPSDDR